MQKISLQLNDACVYTDFNPWRHSTRSHAQDAIVSALETLSTGNESTISEHVFGGLLDGCKVRRFSDEEAGEFAKYHSSMGVKFTGNYYLNDRSRRWRREYTTAYDDQALEHFDDLFSACGVVISAKRTNKKGKTRSAWAHVIYDDPRDVETLLAIIDGTWEPGLSENDQIAPVELDDELPPLECYGSIDDQMAA